jgi:outer membrane protein OmpA-like peptidoglycan-associated protein
MRKISGILLSLALLCSVGLSVANAAETAMTIIEEKQYLADTPTKYGFKGLYTLFSPDTYQQGKFGIGIYWDMTRFCLPGDPRYPQLQEFTLAGAYGITDRLEIGVAAPFRSLNIPAASLENRLSTDDGTKEISESGFSNLSVGLRFNLLKGENFSLTPYVQAFLPTAQDPDKGLGADNTRILFGVSAGTVLTTMRDTRLYTQVAYQYATDYGQTRKDFTEKTPSIPSSQPRFERFGTNPLFHEYGDTLFYGAGLAIPLSKEGLLADLFGEFLFYHSFEDKGYIPMFEDGKELDIVQDGGMANAGLKIGFGNGVALTAGWGGILFAKEPMYESPTWKAFAGLTYNRPEKEEVVIERPPIPGEEGPGKVGEVEPPKYVAPPTVGAGFDCRQELAMVHFEFDKSTLTPEGIETLKRIGKIMRLCDRLVLEVQGHTDWMGTENYNMGLGNRRARAVVYYLVYDEGIDPARIVKPEKLAKGIIAGETYGESVPIATNETDAGRALNRRAQFVKLVEDNRVLTAQ